MSAAGIFGQLTDAQRQELLKKLLSGLLPNGASPAVAPPVASEAFAKLVQKAVRLSMAQDARGEKMRGAWRKIGEGAKELLAALTEPQSPDK